jgi:uncharacterized protein YndB with AHSA1/START domain
MIRVGESIMPISPLAKKLHIKPGHRILLIKEPAGYRSLLQPLPEGAELANGKGKDFDCVQLFVASVKELNSAAPKAVKAVKPDGLLWICYPKGSSKVKSDLTRDSGWDAVTKAGLEGVSLVSIDDTWSAMRFRPASAPKAAAAGRLREKHQRPNGYSVGRSKTIAAGVGRVFAAWQDERMRRRWLKDSNIHIHKATPNRSMRVTWIDGTKSVDVAFYPKGADKCQVTVQHAKLADAKAAERMKAYWEECLVKLKELLEG